MPDLNDEDRTVVFERTIYDGTLTFHNKESNNGPHKETEISDDESDKSSKSSEDDLETSAVDMDTILDDYDYTAQQMDSQTNDVSHPEEITFAPSEGQI